MTSHLLLRLPSVIITSFMGAFLENPAVLLDLAAVVKAHARTHTHTQPHTHKQSAPTLATCSQLGAHSPWFWAAHGWDAQDKLS